MRSGVLYRSASLSHLTDEGVRALSDLAVGTVLDLRGDDEVERDGADRVPAATRVVRRTMDPTAGAAAAADGPDGTPRAGAGGKSADTAALVARLVGATDPRAVAEQMMHGVYRTFITDPQTRRAVGATLRDVARAPGPALVHCSAGKDRTGWIVALVQHLCGVGEEDRLAEYLASAEATSSPAATIPPLPGLDPQALAPLLSVEPDYLLGAWELAGREHGDIDGYLVACGVTEADRDALASRFGLG